MQEEFYIIVDVVCTLFHEKKDKAAKWKSRKMIQDGVIIHSMIQMKALIT